MSDKYEIRERTITNLKFRITLFFLFFFIAIFAVFIITSVMEVNTVVRFVGSRLAVPPIERAAEIIDGDAFEELSRTLDGNDPYYETTRLKLLDLKERMGCVYLYTMAPVNEKIYRYIIDGSAPPEDEENFSPIGSEQDVTAWGSFMESQRNKQILLGSIEQDEEWGQLISAYGPVLNSRGGVVGVIGCDIEADTIITWVRNRVFWQLGIVAAFTALGLAVYLGLLRRINRVYQAE